MKKISKISTIIVLLALMLGSMPVQPVLAATLTVTSTADTDTPGTLRYAINNAAAGDTIEFDLTYPATIVLSGNIEIANALTISGPGQENLTIDANSVGNAFNISTIEDVTINDLSISNGSAADGGAIYKAETSGVLTLTRVTFSSNNASNDGGAIFSNGSVDIAESNFSSNSAGGDGGAIMASDSTTLTVSTTTFTANTAVDYGGAIHIDANSITVTQNTFENNQAADGGAISTVNGNLGRVANSTFYGNTASNSGGGVYNSLKIIILSNNTFSANSAATGGGVYNDYILFMMFNNIVANSSSGDDCINSGGFLIGSGNLIETGTCAADITDDPLLGPLQDNGGLTETMALLTGSPAIDAGGNTICSNAPVSNIDQRGVPRPIDGDEDTTATCDIGAFEVKITPTLSVTNSPVMFNASPQAAVVTGSTAGSVSNIQYDGSPTVPSAIGSYAITADFTPDDTGSFKSLSSASAGNFIIDPETIAPTVDSFTATSPATTFEIEITAFSASDNIEVTDYMITESSTAPAFDDAGWTGTAPSTFTVTADGSYTLYPWAKDASGNVSIVFGSPAAVTVDAPPPSVNSVARADSSPTNAGSVDFTVTFSESVTGVDSADFSLTITDGIAGESITAVSGSGDSYTVTVDTGSGDGTVRLDVLDDDSIIDGDSLPLDGGYTSGEVYNIDKTAPDTSIDIQPDDPSADTAPSFEFSSPDGTATFACQIDAGGFGACTSPHALSGLGNGGHTFEVRAVDPVGNTDATPASYTWDVDSTPPSVSTIVRADSSPTNAASVDFTVTFSESVSGVDSADFSLTTTGAVSGESVTSVSGSGDSYIVSVNTGSGNGTIRLDVFDDDTIIDTTSLPLDVGFTSGEVYDIDKAAPDTSINAQPSHPSSDTSPSFEFSSPDGTATFECQLDSGGFSPCTSPHSYPGLILGEHTFEVRATDLLGNPDASPASYSWMIGEIIFWDDFETNDFSRWTRFNSGGGFLYTCAQAGINGSYGACVERGSNDKRKQLIDDSPANETFFSGRFNIDINNLHMTTGERFRFMQFKMDAERPAFIVLKYDSGVYSIQLNTLLDDLTKVKSGWVTLPNAATTIEVEWQQSSGADDGFARLYLNEVLQDELTGLDNDEIYVTSFRMGFTSRLEGKSISGIFYIDDVASSNGGYIGLP